MTPNETPVEETEAAILLSVDEATDAAQFLRALYNDVGIDYYLAKQSGDELTSLAYATLRDRLDAVIEVLDHQLEAAGER